MLFWNRVEIYWGYSSKEFTDLRNALAVENIKYDYKMLHKEQKILYHLYVHLKDYDRAMHLTSNRNNKMIHLT